MDNIQKIQDIKPIGLDEFVYIKILIASNKIGIPTKQYYLCRDNTFVQNQEDADVYTLNIANDFLKKHPKHTDPSRKKIIRYEIESIRPY